MKIKKLDFIENELYEMFENYIHEIFPSFYNTNRDYYKLEIANWQGVYDIYVTYDNNTITGFMCGHVIPEWYCKAHYYIEHIFVKPKYRNTKAAYLLYNEAVKKSKRLNMVLIGEAHADTISIAEKLGRPLFYRFIREV
jgi:GNAT superfamily N-acetyltransferase